MRTRVFAALLISTALGPTGLWAQKLTEADRAAVQAATDGRALFVTYCASCHGADARGNGPIADLLRTQPPSLRQFSIRNRGVFPAERIHRIIDGKDQSVRAHGSFEMPVWGDAFRTREGLNAGAIDARIEAIVRYLSAIQERLAH